jgi:hypothetical protein
MKDNHGHLDKDAHLQPTLLECPEPGKVLASPLGWSIKGRLLGAAAASGLLWLAVVWALGWLG